MKYYVIVGLDFSLTSPGMSAIKVYQNKTMKVIDFFTTKTVSTQGWHERLNIIQTEVLRFVFKHKPKKIFVENYSYGSTNGRELAGEVHGVVLFKLIESGFPEPDIQRVIPPTSLKKFATGRGNKVEKKEIVDYVNDKFGLSLKVSENDMADAIVLAEMGFFLTHYLDLKHNLLPYQVEVIEKILAPKVPKKKTTKKKKTGGNKNVEKIS